MFFPDSLLFVCLFFIWKNLAADIHPHLLNIHPQLSWKNGEHNQWLENTVSYLSRDFKVPEPALQERVFTFYPSPLPVDQYTYLSKSF